MVCAAQQIDSRELTAAMEVWVELEHLLCDLTFVEAKCLAGMTYDLQADYHAALDAWPGYATFRIWRP